MFSDHNAAIVQESLITAILFNCTTAQHLPLEEQSVTQTHLYNKIKPLTPHIVFANNKEL